jgi:hypothetical protein
MSTTDTGRWVALDAEAQADYLAGELIPLEVRETDAGVEVFDPHDMQTGRFTHTCARCGLMPFDYERFDTPCDPVKGSPAGGEVSR